MIEPYPCPRCGERCLQGFYGPCEDCRTELKQQANERVVARKIVQTFTRPKQKKD